MSAAATFGIVVPTRNRPRSLARALDSVRRQELADWRMVVVDDASDAGRRDENRRVAADPRIRFLPLQGRMGAAAARNRGADALDTPWLVFMDDDCWWAPDRLARLRAASRSVDPDVRYLYTRMVTVDPGGAAVVHGVRGTGPFTGGWRTGTPTMVVERERFNEAGRFDESLPRLQDFDLALRLMLLGDALFVPDAVVWAEGGAGISADQKALARASAAIAAKYSSDSRLDRRDWAFMHRALGYRFMSIGSRSEGIRHYALAIRRDPLQAVHWFGLAASLMGGRFYGSVTRFVERRRGVEPEVAEAREWLPPQV